MNYVFHTFSKNEYLRQKVRADDAALALAIQDFWVSMAIDHKPESAFSPWPLASGEMMLEFSPVGPRARSIDFRPKQCAHIVELYDTMVRIDE